MDLGSILSKKAADLTPPVPLPQGLYVAQVEKFGDVREIGQNKTPGIDMTMRLTQPLDVEVPADCEFPRAMRMTHWLSESSLYRFKEFLTNTLGIEEGQKDLGEMIREATGRMFRVEVVQKAYTRKGASEPEMINDVGSTFALE